MEKDLYDLEILRQPKHGPLKYSIQNENGEIGYSTSWTVTYSKYTVTATICK
jgi:hypothetical protein